MRFLIVSDVHGNRFGLESVLAHARDSYETIFCLGDVVGYGAHPNECCNLLREHGAVSLLGNHDAAALGLINIDWFNPIAKAAILWTREQLTRENHDWLGDLLPHRTFPEHKFQAVHASLLEPLEEYITGPKIAGPNLLAMKQPLCFFGHTHVPARYRSVVPQRLWKRPEQLEGATLLGSCEFELEKGWKYLVNPGSCGQPRDGNRQARYAIFDTKTNLIAIHAIDYDWNAARAAIIAAGLPPILGDRLLHGN